MHMVTVMLHAPERDVNEPLESAVVTDLLWISATPDDGLEHIHSRLAARSACITFFVIGESLANAESSAVAICRRALLGAPALSGWQFADPKHPTYQPHPPHPPARRTAP